jgi:hypothetical protein
MCDPVSASAVLPALTGGAGAGASATGAAALAPLALTVGPGALQAYGQIREGQNANAVGIRTQQDANANAAELKKQSRDAIIRGEISADRVITDAGRDIGAGRAGFAGGNVDLSSGSAQFWELDALKNASLDASTVRYNAGQEAYKYRVDARNERARGVMARFAGREAMHQGYLAATGTALSTAGSVAKMGFGA